MSMTEKFEIRAKAMIEGSIAVKQSLVENTEIIATVASIAEMMIAALKQGGKLLWMGNGGSAADAQHICAEFVGRFAFERPALPALALSVNTSCVTAIGNDYGFDRVFSRQIEAIGRPGDVAVGISTSGNSPNVLCGLSAAARLGLRTVALTGQSGGKIKSAAEYCVCVPSNETPRIQECHILIGHIIADIVEQAMFGHSRENSK